MTAGLVAVVGAIVLGILGMHAFAHDPMQMPGADHGVAVATTVDPASHDMTTTAIDATAASAPGETVADVRVPAHSMGDMVMLCAAMLLAVAAGILLALRLRQHIASIPISIRPRPCSRTFPVTARVGIGPPAEWKFSVVRC